MEEPGQSNRQRRDRRNSPPPTLPLALDKDSGVRNGLGYSPEKKVWGGVFFGVCGGAAYLLLV